jgi:uncharacterized membrane protein YbaN (DUF454 family)
MRRPIVKLAYNVAGCVAVGLAVAGALLPLLPATPFLLLASACFVRGSDRLHAWLMNHRVFGAYIRNFREHRAMPMRAKVVTVAILWASIAYSIARLDVFALDVALAATAVFVTAIIFRMKTLRGPAGGPE